MFLSEWREFPSAPCLAEKKLDDSSRLDVVEIAWVPDISILVGEVSRLRVHINCVYVYVCVCVCVCVCIYIYTGCLRRKGQYSGRS